MSSLPNFLTAALTRASISFALLTSVLIKIASPPTCCINSWVSTSASSGISARADALKSEHTTLAPSRPNRREMARPRPDDDPVTIATLLRSRCDMVIVYFTLSRACWSPKTTVEGLENIVKYLMLEKKDGNCKLQCLEYVPSHSTVLWAILIPFVPELCTHRSCSSKGRSGAVSSIGWTVGLILGHTQRAPFDRFSAAFPFLELSSKLHSKEGEPQHHKKQSLLSVSPFSVPLLCKRLIWNRLHHNGLERQRWEISQLVYHIQQLLVLWAYTYFHSISPAYEARISSISAS